METFDVCFEDCDYSNNKGFEESFEYCYNYIKTYCGTNESYFEDYKFGTVQIVLTQTGEIVSEYLVSDGTCIFESEDFYIPTEFRELMK